MDAYSNELESKRLVLRLVTATDAAALHPLLDDALLHTHIGGEPLSEIDLRAWFGRLESRTSPDESEGWLTWVVRDRTTGEPVGYVQATTTGDTADLAWVIGRDHQNRGYATEAASAIVKSLAGSGFTRFSASIGRANTPSRRVAERLGLQPTGTMNDEEEVWAR